MDTIFKNSRNSKISDPPKVLHNILDKKKHKEKQ